MNDKAELNLKKTLWKLAYASRAIDQVLTTCDFYLEHIRDDRHPMFIPLMCSICVTYCRPFTNNSGIGSISQKKFARYSDPDLQKAHDVLWRSRMHFHAHADTTVRVKDLAFGTSRLQEVRVAVTRKKGPDGDQLSFGLIYPEMRVRAIVVPHIRNLCLELAKRLRAEINSILYQLYGSSGAELAELLDERQTDYTEIVLDIAEPANMPIK
jgi:hypothetical protein